MAEFADRMKSFTDHLRGSIQMRGEAISQVQATTKHLLDDARTFLGEITDQHRARAVDLRATLASHRTECRQNVAEMRQAHQGSLKKMRDDLHQLLSEARKTRQDAVHQMSQEFQETRQGLASDLHEASNAWREFASSVAVNGFQVNGVHAEEPAANEHEHEREERHSQHKPARGKHAKSRRA
jgi:ElaB/YqjD/DUF883 family membrane-anchored ribosome-binding protein